MVFSSRRRHTKFLNVTGGQTCALPIYGVCCSLKKSLDDVHKELELRWSVLHNRCQVFDETGTALWNGNIYTYRIWNNEKHGGWSLYDCYNNSYCPIRHEFLPDIVCNMMAADCKKCAEIIKVIDI